MQSSGSRPTVPGARIRALPAAARPPAPRRDRRPAQALGPCRQGARVSAVTAPGSGRPPPVVVARRFAHASRSAVRSRTRFPKRWNAGPAPLTEDARLDRHRRHERALRASATMPSSAQARAHRPRPARGLRGPAPARRAPLPPLAPACLPRPPSRARSEAPAAHLRPAWLPHRTRRPALRRGPRAGAAVRAHRARHRARTTRRIEPAGPGGGPRTVTQCRATLGRRSCARRGPVGQRSCVVRRIRGP